ncbi:hypothetical protein [Candidatus Berkiella cookevillensis]|uniref:Uncharacterized protein n=1 Tax=Candidatus Berkiella cookevillensis TaxID=437022 RepID=A0A0Q9YCN5_9GAMM|nr:hypothetical protein [Candidatus Berkiella cookevillensis]
MIDKDMNVSIHMHWIDFCSMQQKPQIAVDETPTLALSTQMLIT